MILQRFNFLSFCSFEVSFGNSVSIHLAQLYKLQASMFDTYISGCCSVSHRLGKGRKEASSELSWASIWVSNGSCDLFYLKGVTGGDEPTDYCPSNLQFTSALLSFLVLWSSFIE